MIFILGLLFLCTTSVFWAWSALILCIWVALILQFFLKQRHVLMLLLVLEALFIVAISLLNTTMGLLSASLSLWFYVFTLAVVEASLGLGLLIFLTRAQGNETIVHLYWASMPITLNFQLSNPSW